MRAVVEELDQDGVRGFLHRPEAPTEAGLILTHGAGGNCRAALLVAAASAFCAAGIAVLRCDLPFRQQRPAGPPPPSGAVQDRDGLRRAVTVVREIVGGRIVLGGQSYGGRQASMLAVEQPGLVEGLLLFSYPLHSPAKPDRLRTDHFPRLQAPAIFVSGTRDPFGSIAELESAISAIPAWKTLIPIDGAGHDLRRGKFDFLPIIGALLAMLSPRR